MSRKISERKIPFNCYLTISQLEMLENEDSVDIQKYNIHVAICQFVEHRLIAEKYAPEEWNYKY